MSTLSVSPRFAAGEVVFHRRFGYRGVIISVDDSYQGTEEWYERAARSHPPRDQPWYHVLIHGSTQEAYVAERNLQLFDAPVEVEHPLVWVFFDEMVEGRYIRNRMMN